MDIAIKIHEVLRNEVRLTQAPKSLTARIVMNVIKADGVMTQYRVWISAGTRNSKGHGAAKPIVKIRWHALRQSAPHSLTGQCGTVDPHKHFRVYQEVEALAWKIVDLTAAKLA